MRWNGASANSRGHDHQGPDGFALFVGELHLVIPGMAVA
jgi:hypothetical protein